MGVTMAGDSVMVVMDMVVTVESVPLNLTMAMDTDAVMDMVVTDMVDTVARDLLMPKPQLAEPEAEAEAAPEAWYGYGYAGFPYAYGGYGYPYAYGGYHYLGKRSAEPSAYYGYGMAVVMDMAVTDMVDTVERDPLNHTTDMVDTDHTEDTDMAVMAMAMVVKSYLQEAKGFYYLIFRK